MSSTTDISDDLKNFFCAEFANERAMRAEARAKGGDDQDHDDDRFVPEASLDSAFDSWVQAPDDVQADLLRLPADLTPAERSARLAQAKADLLDLIEHNNGDTLLRSLV